MKKAAAKRRQREQAVKQVKTQDAETQESELADVIGNLDGDQKISKPPQVEKLIAKQKMIINLGQNYTPLDKRSTGHIELGMMRQSIDADTVKLEKYTKYTEMSVSKSKKKLSPPNTNNPSLTISNSLNKITLTPPLGPISKAQ